MNNIKSSYNTVPIQNRDAPGETHRETTNYNDVSNSKSAYNSVPIHNQDAPGETQRETTNYNDANFVGTNQLSYIKNNDTLTSTIRELVNNYDYDRNLKSTDNSIYIKDKYDKARETIKENNILYDYLSNINSSTTHSKNYVISKDVNLKDTLKQTTIYANNNKVLNSTNSNNYIKDVNYTARETIKQESIYTNYIGGARGTDKQISDDASNNMSVDDRKEKVLETNAPNGYSNLYRHYIDTSTFEPNERTNIEYFSHPRLSLDYNAVSNNCIDIPTVKNSSKTTKDNNDDIMYNYSINDIFTESLKSNPYINNMVHKNNYVN